MGYDIHITRREHWADAEAFDISYDEWLTYVNSDEELELMEQQNIKGYCEWNAHPTENTPSSRPWFSYWNGSIETKNPDEQTIRKMIETASVLNAKVQGDDGEIYSEGNLTGPKVTGEQDASLKQRNNKQWWKFW